MNDPNSEIDSSLILSGSRDPAMPQTRILGELVDQSLALAAQERTPAQIKRFLIVDDEPDICDLIIHFLESARLGVTSEFTVAHDGREALQALDTERNFDVIISGLIMPGMNGIEFYREVERAKPELCPRFVYQAGYSGNSETRAFFKEVSNTLVAKPYTGEQLLAAVRGVLEGSSRASSTSGT